MFGPIEILIIAVYVVLAVAGVVVALTGLLALPVLWRAYRFLGRPNGEMDRAGHQRPLKDSP